MTPLVLFYAGGRILTHAHRKDISVNPALILKRYVSVFASLHTFLFLHFCAKNLIIFNPIRRFV